MKKNKIDEVLVRKKKRNLVASAAKEKLIVNDDEEKDDQEMLLENIPDFDHVPSDSAEELSESESKTQSQNVTKEEPIKKIYTDFTENTVFVGNLPVTYDKKKVIKAFSRFGSIVCARIRCVPIANINMSKKVSAIKKEFNPHRNSLVAYVKFKSENSAKAAIEANGMVLGGHHLRIDSAECNKNRDVRKAVFVGGLPFNTEDDELWEFFEHCGKINSVRVIRDSHTSMGKGIGYVNFDSTTAVELALQMDGQEFKKRVINVKRCLDNKKKNKSKSFGKKKTQEVVGELLSKKNRTKLKIKNKEFESFKKSSTSDFQGTKADLKKKKYKKPSKDVLRKKRIMNILQKK